MSLGPTPMTFIFRERKAKRKGEESHMTMEAEIGGMCLQTKQLQDLLTATRSQEKHGAQYCLAAPDTIILVPPLANLDKREVLISGREWKND